jgi:hypothetical protein
MQRQPQLRRGPRHRRVRSRPRGDAHAVERIVNRDHPDAERRDRAGGEPDERGEAGHRDAEHPDHLEEAEEAEVLVEVAAEADEGELQDDEPEPARDEEPPQRGERRPPQPLELRPRAGEEREHRCAEVVTHRVRNTAGVVRARSVGS